MRYCQYIFAAADDADNDLSEALGRSLGVSKLPYAVLLDEGLQQPVQPLQSIIVVKRIVRPPQPVQILAGLQTETKILAISQNAHLHVP